MNRQRYQRMEELFHAALDLPEEQRAAFLDRTCADDPDLRQKLAGMLQRDRTRDNSLLERQQPEPPPERIGPYRIERAIGEGGFALVYLAEQEKPLRRQVALKILKPGLDTRATLARFEAERQALAAMNHDGIARIYDAGATGQGRPYFVMEYVPGLPITEYCDNHSLDNRRRLELFAAVCDAVHHAHQKGVIHRDLKPGNILVAEIDGRPQIKVIDFGIAKATTAVYDDQTMFTQHGQVLGTPEYMSPEQAGFGPGDIDTRTDIYSLGVVLYELLTGLPPFSREALRLAGFAEVQRIIREVDPPRPSTRLSTKGENTVDIGRKHQTAPRTLIRQLRSDLDWVVLMAMEKDRERRYRSPAGLAVDIRRYLAHKPLAARPPSAAYRLQKFSRRNKLGLTMAGALVVGLIGIVGGVTVALMESNRQREKVEAALVEVQLARDESQDVTDYLSRMLAAPRRYKFGRDVTVLALLDTTLATLDDDLADRPQINAQVRRTIGSAYLDLDLDAAAEPALSRALNDHEALLGPDHPQTLLSLVEFCELLMVQGRFAEADSFYIELYERCRRVTGAGSLRSLSAMQQRGTTLVKLNRYAEAENLLVKAWQGAQGVIEPDTQMYYSFASELGNFYAEVGRFDEAEPLLTMVLEGRTLLRGEDHTEVLEAVNNLALLYADQGRFQDAIPYLRHAHELQDRLLGPEHYEALLVRNNLAAISSLLFDWDTAEELYTTGVELVRQYHGTSERITQHFINNLGYLALRRGQWVRAEELLTEAYELRLEHHGAKHRDTAVSVNNLGELALLRGDPALAESLHRQNLVTRTELLGPEHQHTLGSMVNLGHTLGERGKTTEADSMLAAALTVMQQTLDTGHRATINAACYLGRLRLQQGRENEIEGTLKPLVAVSDSALVAADPLHGAVRTQLAVCALVSGRREEAIVLLDEAGLMVPESLTAALPWRRDYFAARSEFENSGR